MTEKNAQDATARRQRAWIRLDAGLLDQRDFYELTPDAMAVWLNVYLLLARNRDRIDDRDALRALLRRALIDSRDGEGWVDVALAEIEARGWIVTDEEGVTLRGYDTYQPLLRGPSDDPEAKAERARRARAARKADDEQAARAEAATGRGKGAPTPISDFTALVPRPK